MTNLIILIIVFIILFFTVNRESFQINQSTKEEEDAKKAKDLKLKRFCRQEYNNCLVNDQLADCRQLILSNHFRCQYSPFPWD